MANNDLSGYSNEQLLKLADSGTAAEKVLADAELLRRGNTNVDGRAQRTVKGSVLHNEPTIAADDDVTITDGKITAVNGNPYP
jgi:hypothetical protein